MSVSSSDNREKLSLRFLADRKEKIAQFHRFVVESFMATAQFALFDVTSVNKPEKVSLYKHNCAREVRPTAVLVRVADRTELKLVKVFKSETTNVH